MKVNEKPATLMFKTISHVIGSIAAFYLIRIIMLSIHFGIFGESSESNKYSALTMAAGLILQVGIVLILAAKSKISTGLALVMMAVPLVLFFLNILDFI